MQIRHAAVVVALLSTVATGTGARAETATWVSTFPIQTGATERVEVGADHSAWAVIDHSRVLKSTDLGVSWLPVNPVPVSGAPASGPVQGGSSETSVAPVSAQVALGGNGNRISKTIDGGLSWQQVKVPSVTSPAGLDGVDLLRRAAGRFWLAPGGFNIVKSCAVPLASTPLLSSADGVRWTRSDIPIVSGLVFDLEFADLQHGAASVYDFHFTRQQSGRSCGFAGSTSDSVVFTTADGGRSWKKAYTCVPACSLGWAKSKLTLARSDGMVLDSRNFGRTFTRTGAVRVLPGVLGVQALNCAGDRCWALANGTGIHRRDGAGEWALESSDADVAGLCVAGLAAIDRDHAVAAGPHALMTRLGTGAVPQRQTSTRSGVVRIGPFATVGTDGVRRMAVLR